eukprot:883153-Prorocentrum_minimum.AAC.2
MTPEQRRADEELEAAALDALCDAVLTSCAAAPDHLRRCVTPLAKRHLATQAAQPRQRDPPLLSATTDREKRLPVRAGGADESGLVAECVAVPSRPRPRRSAALAAAAARPSRRVGPAVSWQSGLRGPNRAGRGFRVCEFPGRAASALGRGRVVGRPRAALTPSPPAHRRLVNIVDCGVDRPIPPEGYFGGERFSHVCLRKLYALCARGGESEVRPRRCPRLAVRTRANPRGRERAFQLSLGSCSRPQLFSRLRLRRALIPAVRPSARSVRGRVSRASASRPWCCASLSTSAAGVCAPQGPHACTLAIARHALPVLVRRCEAIVLAYARDDAPSASNSDGRTLPRSRFEEMM